MRSTPNSLTTDLKGRSVYPAKGAKATTGLEKSKILLKRSVAKIMLKTSRRTDSVAHLGNGVFAMLLKHTDRIGAGKTVERLSDIINTSAIFLEGEEINVEIVAGVVEIISEEDVEICLSHTLKKMEEAQKDNVLYYVYEGN